MKRSQPQTMNLNTVLKAIGNMFHNMFYSSSNRDFQRLKNFIAS